MTDTSGHPWADWISTDTIDKLYSEVMRRWGGAVSAPTPGCIDAALGAAYNAELYTPEDGEGLTHGLLFAAYLFFYIVTKHCYVDGNKRLAWACLMFVLLSFDLTIAARQDDIVEFCLSVAKGEVNGGAVVASWVSERLVAIA
jgi:death-on-curing protein